LTFCCCPLYICDASVFHAHTHTHTTFLLCYFVGGNWAPPPPSPSLFFLNFRALWPGDIYTLSPFCPPAWGYRQKKAGRENNKYLKKILKQAFFLSLKIKPTVQLLPVIYIQPMFASLPLPPSVFFEYLVRRLRLEDYTYICINILHLTSLYTKEGPLQYIFSRNMSSFKCWTEDEVIFLT